LLPRKGKKQFSESVFHDKSSVNISGCFPSVLKGGGPEP
jgi:hypothetical protein